VITIRRRIVMLMSAAFMTLGLAGAVAAPQQSVCVDVYVEVDGAPVVDESACLPPA
jgi:hypothetical protein